MTSGVMRDFGERRLIAELLGKRYGDVDNFGDDAARLPQPPDGATLVATTDPCPPPMSAQLGVSDLYYYGWLLATINLSDLAAAGAEPLGLLTSFVLRADTPVADFERLLDGVDDCAQAVGTRVVGGNLKEGKDIDLSGTAVGACAGREPLSRRGAAVGDVIVVIGDLGTFWAGVLAVKAGRLADPIDPLLRNVFRPQAKVVVMSALAREGLLTAAIDNSDGLYPSLAQLAAANGVGCRLEHERFVFTNDVLEVAGDFDLDPVRLALGWGDWQVVTTAKPDLVERIRKLGGEHGVPVHELGVIVPGTDVLLELDGEAGLLLALDSERFAAQSWFTVGLAAYIAELTKAPLLRSR